MPYVGADCLSVHGGVPPLAFSLESSASHASRVVGWIAVACFWGAMAAGPTDSWGEWLELKQLLEVVELERLTGMRGSVLIISDIEASIPGGGREPLDFPTLVWMGAFSWFDVLILVRGRFEERVLLFEVEDDGRLERI